MNNKTLSNNMTVDEFCNWFALANALKFINNTSALTGKSIKEKDIDTRQMIEYVNSVSGDIKTCLETSGGIPHKYSLVSSEDSLNTNELSYDQFSN